jgi:hypothetical protein
MTDTTPAKRRALLAFMLDRPGVLNKVAMLIRRKMYNVETLTVCKTNQPGTSRMTITLREASDAKMLQVVKQIAAAASPNPNPRGPHRPCCMAWDSRKRIWARPRWASAVSGTRATPATCT